MLGSNHVWCAKAGVSSYDSTANVELTELPKWAKPTTALVTLRGLLAQARLDSAHFGSRSWNPLGSIIQPGAKVVVKPNWVHHCNLSGYGSDCLITHPSVIEAVLHYVAKARPERIVVGDAPLQGCDFAALADRCRLADMVKQFTAVDVDISTKDFRRTIQPSGRLGGRPQECCRPMSEFVLYDLADQSALEVITTPASEFRVTMYNPDTLKRTHGPGRHQYLIARDVMEADVVINVPKLKTHKKSCITGALKNLVGINGHKEYLPHHRKGGSQDGGDCYMGRSRLSGIVEDLLDATNRSRYAVSRRILANAARLAMTADKALHANDNYEGSWHGNDTVWRTCLDLQRVLHYGQLDGVLSDRLQRTVLTITDAIVAGDGDGPLAPTPIPLGMITLGVNTAAVEWVHALLMGLDPQRIPLTREAFAPHRYPLTTFRQDEIVVRVDGQPVRTRELFSQHGRAFCLPKGWQGHAELHGAAHGSERPPQFIARPSEDFL
jgi:uncharacterized protein (DUF362 family)